MKKLLTSALCILTVGQANAQSLEDRVEALEFQSYENFFKVSGSLEMRFDNASREINKGYRTYTDVSAYADAFGQVAAIDPGQLGAFAAAGCGESVTVGAAPVKKAGCVDHEAGDSSSNSYARLFFNLDMESNPTDKLSFYGRLSMAKYLTTVSSTGSTDGSFSDFSAGATASDSSVWVERAFANYAISDTLTFTFGRMPTIDGAPTHHHTNEPMKGNYPILAFSAIFDGMALTKTYGKHTFRGIYSPFSTPNYNDTFTAQTDADGNEVNRTEDVYTAMYEYRSKVDFARQIHVIGMYSQFDNMPIAGESNNLKLGVQRATVYAEASDIGNSGLDIAVHGMTSKTKSEGSLVPASLGIGTLGWLSDEESSEKDGVAYGILAKYNFNSGFMKGSSLGAEYFHGDKDAFLYDSGNVDPVSMYTTYGNAYRVFYTKDLAGGLKWNLQYLNQQQDYHYPVNGLIGARTEIDNKVSFVSTSFIANF
ncbi:MAG: DUF3373 family protein [Bacteriovoracaceae bacterium]|nr:DUF3373 family protein [Bacteriovoracaceae bacterium]